MTGLSMRVVGVETGGFIVISISVMGSKGSTQKSAMITNEQQQLVFYTNVDDPNLGQVKIYTSRKIPLCYILKYERKLDDTKIYNQFKKIEQLQPTCLLSLYGFRIDRQTCCQQIYSEVVTSYWEYYNFYFSDYLAKRSAHTCMFVESEIWHIVEVCCEAYGLFRKYGLYYEINPSTMVVTPEGKLKGFWSHLKSQNNHLKYIQYFDKSGYLQKFFYSPEELEYMYIQQRTTKIDFDKANSFRLGMIILQTLTLSNPISLCYNPSMTKINFNVIRGLILNKVMPSYPPDMVRLVKSLLKEDPRERPTLMEVFEMYSGYFSSEFELRVCGGKPKDSFREGQGQNFGRSEYQNEGRGEYQSEGLRQVLNQKKTSDFSDVKTVKLSHSLRKA